MLFFCYEKSLREIEITKVKVARIWMQDEKFHLFISLSWDSFLKQGAQIFCVIACFNDK